MVYFELRNRASEFIAAAMIEQSKLFYSVDELDDTFNDKIVEYDWEEDQSNYNALAILKDLLLSITDNPNLNIGLVWSHEDEYDPYSEDLVKKNYFTNEISLSNGVITFLKNYPPSVSKEYQYEFIRACENIQEQY